ncbi:virginiamycin B lyase family protein [Mesoterricola silvestris]|uniref:Pentapeptide repeat protein n=1 Tax=Mesoterricola silvestris TaxID=2927979 RepID=A0AA48H542_9BACT|nr:pentapeptide repeat-containing protein [Mesoterricola silvestris]BDU72033.1 hypothetical protein METEAL_12070 [Mesoterricola silvestris]
MRKPTLTLRSDLRRAAFLAGLAGLGWLPLAAADPVPEGKGAPAEATLDREEIVELMASLLGELKDFRFPAPWTAKAPPVVGGILSDLTLRGLHLRAGADLRGADLRDADLRRVDLTGADLRGADLTRAKLASAILTGARLEGARFYCADIAGATGLDLTGTRLHPFFEIREDEEVGHIKTLNLAELGTALRGQLQNLACGPDGRLFWTEGDDPTLENISVTGLRHAVEAAVDTRLYALVADTRGRLWSVGDRMFGSCSLEGVGQTATGSCVPFNFRKMEFPDPPNQVVAGTDGDVWISLSDRAFRLSLAPSMNQYEVAVLEYRFPGPAAQTRVVANAAGTATAFAIPEQEAVFVFRGPAAPVFRLGLPPGSRPRRMVQGIGGQVWFTQTGTPAIGVIAGDGTAGQVHFLKDPDAQPHGIAPGADGCMWFTDPAKERLGRITAAGVITWFPLAKGNRPLEITPAPDGRMLFTLEGRPSIGSIRTVIRPATWFAAGPADRLGEETAESKAFRPKACPPPRSEGPATPWEVPVYHPRPAPPSRTLGREERQAQHQRRKDVAERALLARQSVETAEPVAPRPSPAAPRSPSKELPALLEHLEAQEVLLTPGAVHHSLARHGSGSTDANGRWAAAWEDPEALAPLIARGLLASGVIAKVTAPDGAFVTACESKEIVGTYRDRLGVHPTRWFRVITERHAVDGQEIQVVMTAYPIAEHWR